MPWGGPGGLVPGGWALKRTQPEKREDTVRTRLLAALFESQFMGTELAAWCAPIPGGPVNLTLAAWVGALVAQRCLFLEAAEQGYQLDGPAVLALVNELALEQKLAPTVKVGTLKGTWDDHEPHGQIAVIYEFRDFEPVGFVRAPRMKTRTLPHMPAAIPDAWKQRDPALLELDYPTEDPRRARLVRWLPAFFDDGTILPPLDPDMAAMFDRLGETREPAPGGQTEPAKAEPAPAHSASTPTAPPATAEAIHGAAAAPGGSTPAEPAKPTGDAPSVAEQPGPGPAVAPGTSPPACEPQAAGGGVESCPDDQAYPGGAPAGFVRGSRWRVTGVDGRDGEVMAHPIWVPFATSQPEHGRWRVLLKFVPSATGPEGAYEQFVDVDKLAPPPRRRGQAVQTPGLFGQDEPVAKTRPSRRKA